MAHDVFVSHSTRNHRDKTIADAICAKLEERRIRCWIAPRDVQPGSTWAEAIVDAVAGSRVMVLVLSAQANGSPHVMREVERAVSKGIPIIPFRIEDVVLSKAMEFFISSSHWLDALTPPIESHLAQLSSTVEFLVRGDQPTPFEPATNETPAAGTKRASGEPVFDLVLLGRIFADNSYDEEWRKAANALCREGKLRHAVDVDRATARSAEQLADADPSGYNVQNAVLVRFHLAHVLSVLGDVPHALEEFGNARAIAERGAASPTGYASCRANIVNARISAGDLLCRHGEHDAALREYRLGLARAEALLAENPDDWSASAQSQIVLINERIGARLAERRDSAGALAAYQAALEAVNQMQDKRPNTSDWQRRSAEIQQRIVQLKTTAT